MVNCRHNGPGRERNGSGAKFLFERFNVNQFALEKIRSVLKPVLTERTDVKFMDGTRRGILNRIRTWVDDLNAPNVLWLGGGPGAGKSSIAVKVAQELFGTKLGSQFFFRRGLLDSAKLWPTVACNLARSHPDLRADILKVVTGPSAPQLNRIDFQFMELIEKPLKNHPTPTPLVIVVDALDECADHELGHLLDSIKKWSTSSLPCKLLVTSRPEFDIQHSLPSSYTVQVKLVSGEATDRETRDDIHAVIKDGLSTISEKHPKTLQNWPAPEDVDKIVSYSAGLFIWATTAVKFIAGERIQKVSDKGKVLAIRDGSTPRRRSGPRERLNLVIAGNMHRGDIDDLYREIMERALEDAFDEPFNAWIGTILFAITPLTLDDIWYLSGEREDREVLEEFLNKLSSLLVEGRGGTYSIHHQSFADFLVKCERSGSFFIDKVEHNSRLALSCIRIMNDENDGLRFNIFNIPTSYKYNDAYPDIQDKISRHLSYSCRFWAEHLKCGAPNDELWREVDEFFYDCFLYWLEVMSGLGELHRAASVLDEVTTYVKVWFSCNYEYALC